VAEFSKQSASWKITQEIITGNGVTSEVDALMYVILSKAEKHEPYGKLVGTTECKMLYPQYHTNLGCYNWVQPYIQMIQIKWKDIIYSQSTELIVSFQTQYCTHITK